jgi:hypothetical protein
VADPIAVPVPTEIEYEIRSEFALEDAPQRIIGTQYLLGAIDKAFDLSPTECIKIQRNPSEDAARSEPPTVNICSEHAWVMTDGLKTSECITNEWRIARKGPK